MSSYLILARDQQQDEKIKKLHSNLSSSLRYASSAQGIQPPPTVVNDIPYAERNTIFNILTSAGLIPRGSIIELGGILLHTRMPPEPLPASKHTLLSLPPEMRNRIYRFALLKPRDIVIRDGERPPEEPGLLATCRQIRKEALDIYWLENSFQIEVKDFYAHFYIKWCKLSENHYRSSHDFQLNGSIGWFSLEQWLKAYYEGHCRCFQARNSNSGMAVAAHLFDIVDEMGADDWSRIRSVLWSTRAMLEKQDRAWGSY